jgi:hypothetical protein
MGPAGVALRTKQNLEESMFTNNSRALQRVSLSLALFGALIAFDNASTAKAAAAAAGAAAAAPSHSTAATSSGGVSMYVQNNDRDPHRTPKAINRPIDGCGENWPFCTQD